MAAIRHQRVAEQMKKELADIIRMEIKDQRIGFITVTRVEVTNDLQHAKVFVSVFGDKEQKQLTLGVLQKASGFIRGEASRRLRMRVTPEMAFVLDESGEYSAHIESVLKNIRDSSAHENRETED
ncbi:30S ribosome-binding factor RbfA [Alicyclobacillus curvatus]|nr:30S ribosome-binding factor RbfA [Alicyclobacillus curvatus]